MTGASARRPLAMRLLPLWARERVYYRVFARHAERHVALYDNAPLALAPGVSLRLNPTDLSHQAIALAGVYELDVSRPLVALARAGGLLADVGANYGYFSCLWAAARSGNHVVAFEGSPRNVTALRSNVDRNGFGSRVAVHDLALGREAGVRGFRFGPSPQTGQGGFTSTEEPADVQVRVATLDEIFAARPEVRIDVLKIDVEGADTWVLEGARELLAQRRIVHIFFEQFPLRMRELGVPAGAARLLLESHGYRLRYVSGDEWYASLSGVKPAC